MRIDLYFRSQLGPVCLKGVEAYVVKGMKMNLLIGKDTQLAWQLHTMHPEGSRYWKVGDSLHCIPGIHGPVPQETFTASWIPATTSPMKTPPVHKKPSKEKRIRWNAVARHQLMILLESIATITAVSQGAPAKGAMYLEGISLKRGSDSMIQAPDGLVDLDSNDCFQVKIANTTK